MAKVNPVRLKQEAEKLEKAGRPDQAIAFYRQIVDDNPRDWNIINKIGDLYAKLNRAREAADEYAKVADFYAKDGFLLKAIAIWKKINKLDASSLEPYQHLAELYAKQGLMMEAKSQYQIVVDEFIKRGRMREAGEVLRKMADIDPGDLKVRSKLADLYTREGSSDKAVGEHIAIAEELNKKGHLAEALQVLEKGLKIDPRSDRLRLELARVHLIQKNYEKAGQYLEEAIQHSPNDPVLLARLGEAYLGGRKIEEAEAIFKRLLELNPNDDEARAQMGRVYLLQDRFDEAYRELLPAVDRLASRREGEKAAALLQQVISRNPQHVKSLAKLADLYRQLQKEIALAATLSQLTEAYIAAGQFEEAAAALEEMVRREPQNQQHRSKLEFVRGKLGGPRPSPPAAPSAIDFEEEEFELPAPPPAAARAAQPVKEAPARPAPPPAAAPPRPPPAPAAPARVVVEPSGPLSEEDREFIEEHIAEGRVFRKYGLIDKAADQFEAVVARFPDNVEARQELREVYREKGALAKAAEQCLALAEIFRLKGDMAAAQAQEEEAARMAPAAVAAPAPAPAMPAPAPAPPAPKAPPSARAAAPAPAPPAEPALAFGLDEEEEEEIALEEEAPLAIEEEEEEIALEVEEPAAIAAAGSEDRTLLDLDVEGADEELPGRFLEDEEPAFAVEEPELSLPAAEPLPLETVPALEEEVPLEEPLPVEEELPLDEVVSMDEIVPMDEAVPVEEAVPLEPVAMEEPAQDLSFDLEQELALHGQEVVSDIQAPAPEVELGLDLEEEPAWEPEPLVEAPPARAEAQGPARAILDEPPAAPPIPSAPLLPAGLHKALDEVDQYMALGFVEDARDALREVSGRHPHHPALLAKLAELGLSLDVLEETPAAPSAELADELLGGLDLEGEEDLPLAVEEPARAAAPLDRPAFEEPLEELPVPAGGLDDDLLQAGPLGPSAGIDLAAELDDLFAPQTALDEPLEEAASQELGETGLAEIFKEFKKGVDKQLGQEDYDTRYNLGIAYKEMGLIDEAISEFQLAAKDEKRLLECASMLGICFLEKGMPKLAIKWFEKGLRAPGRSDEEYLGLRYDLAMAYEASGDPGTALAIFSELYGQDANFRDVAAKVRELRS